MKKKHLRELFARDPKRAKKFSLKAGDLFLDYSKNIITGRTMIYLRALAEACGVHGVIFPTKGAAPFSPAAIKTSAGAVEHLLLVQGGPVGRLRA